MTPRYLPRLLASAMTITVSLGLAQALAPASAAPADPAATTVASSADRAPAARALSTKQRADKYSSTMTLPQFLAVRAKQLPKDGQDPLRWDADGCSIPPKAPNDAELKAFFRNACNRHDFGYRNYGNGIDRTPPLALDSTEARKRKIDAKFLQDMYYQCDHNQNTPTACKAQAKIIFEFVDGRGESWTAFYKGECARQYLCLFDDANYEDRRFRTIGGVSNLKDVNFGDKTSSVKNRSIYAWRLYDDDGFSDRSICIEPGQSIANLDTRDFGDKTSSVKRLAAGTC